MENRTKPEADVPPALTTHTFSKAVQFILSSIGGYLIGKGWIDAETWAGYAGTALTIILTVGPFVWSYLVSQYKARVAAQALRQANLDKAIIEASRPSEGLILQMVKDALAASSNVPPVQFVKDFNALQKQEGAPTIKLTGDPDAPVTTKPGY